MICPYLYVPPVPNFVFSSLLKLSGFSSMPVITVEFFLNLPLVCFGIIIRAASLSNSFIISLKEFSLLAYKNAYIPNVIFVNSERVSQIAAYIYYRRHYEFVFNI